MSILDKKIETLQDVHNFLAHMKKLVMQYPDNHPIRRANRVFMLEVNDDLRDFWKEYNQIKVKRC